MPEAGSREPRSLERLRRTLVIVVCALTAGAAFADTGGWHTLPVPGGRATLSRLGIPEGRERAAVMIDLIRRLHFSIGDTAPLTAALRELAKQGDATDGGVVVLSPLSAQAWAEVLGRPIAPARLVVEILNDERARLLHHGLAGLDVVTRQWFEGPRELLRWLYLNDAAVRSFALFAPAVRVADGAVSIPGGAAAEARWSEVLDSTPRRADQFVRRLFERDAGRTAGLYFVTAAVDEPRRTFILGGHLPPASRAPAFRLLIASFAACYPPRSTAYPFVLRPHDGALLLAEIEVGEAGRLAGPRGRDIWQEVLGDAIRSAPGGTPGDDVDAAWLVDVLCSALAEDRRGVFGTFLAGQRLFADVPAADRADVIAALKARRAYPALFLALEQAGLRRSQTYAAAARHAARVSQISDAGRSITALRGYQGALMLVLNATTAGTLTPDAAAALVESLASGDVTDGRDNGRVAGWIASRWMPAVASVLRPKSGLSAEQTVAAALAGPDPPTLPAMQWEGQRYVVDVAGTVRQRLSDVRARQGGVSLDTVLALNRAAQAIRAGALTPAQVKALRSEFETMARGLETFEAATEYDNDALNPAEAVARAAKELPNLSTEGSRARAGAVAADLVATVDFLLAHVLASWAYAPYLGAADGGALVGGDSSLRHVLGVRAAGRDRGRLRWELAVTPAARGAINGSLLGVQAGLASWSLRRLSSDRVPPPPAIDSNDAIPLTLTATFSNPRRLRDADLTALAAARVKGASLVASARTDAARLVELAQQAAMSPWRRAVLPWMVQGEPGRIEDQFSAIELLRLGGLDLDGVAAWGSIAMAAHTLRLRAPAPWIPEVFAGRTGDGIVGPYGMELMLRVAIVMADLKLPAALAAPVLAYAMRDHLDRVRPVHGADVEAFARQARALTRQQVEDYVGALAAVGPLRPAASQ